MRNFCRFPPDLSDLIISTGRLTVPLRVCSLSCVCGTLLSDFIQSFFKAWSLVTCAIEHIVGNMSH